MNSIQDLIQGVHWDKGISIGSQTFYPITGRMESVVEVEVVSDNVAGISITELESESVNQVYVQSEVSQPRLVISGIVIEGGKQTRSVTRPFIISKKDKRIINVNCVEKGRWAYAATYAKFKVGKRMVSRKTKSSYSVGGHTQTQTWGNISRYMSENDLSMDDIPTENFMEVEEKIREQKSNEITKIRELLQPAFTLSGQRGVVIFEDGVPDAIEVFDDPDKWGCVREKILDSNLLDAINMQGGEHKSANNLPEVEVKLVDPLVDEESYRVKIGDMSGWAVGLHGKITYLTAGRFEGEEVDMYQTNVMAESNVMPEQIQQRFDFNDL